MSSKYHIVFPCGDKTKLSVVEICEGLEYELQDYMVASRESFYTKEDASDYAVDLAKKHNLSFNKPDNNYLD